MKTKRVRPILVEIKGYVGQYPFLGLNDNKLSLYTNENPSNFNVIAQELILISLEDEKIEIGELVYKADTKSKIYKHIPTTNSWYKDEKKVIARQSQISPEYISKFIEQYNNDCVEDLEIEMEELYIYPDGTKSKISRLMPDAKPVEEPNLTNGFVTIVEKEPITYTEEEVRKLISEALYHFCPMNNHREEDEIDWFENNKKK